MPTRSQTAAADIAALTRARNAVLWVNSAEEKRVELYLAQACQSAGYMPVFWDCAAGLTDLSGKRIAGTSDEHADPGITLDMIAAKARARTDRMVWIMRDLHKWMDGPIGIRTLRQLRNLSRELPPLGHTIIILAPSGAIPPELAGGDAIVIEWPLPDRDEIGALLDTALKPHEGKIEPLNGQRDAAIDAAVGLSGLEAEACFAKSLVQSRRIDPVLIAGEKKRVIARAGVLEWFDPLPGGLDAVGGLDNLKSWLTARKAAYSPRARAYGLPAPRGALLVGVPGCGKSLTAKAVATAWGVPLLRLDLGAIKSKYVGESESNLRKAFRTIESVGRCVVWLDEIEKALAGATQGAADGGVSADALGAVLSWMQERTGEAFVIATANDVTSLPPELMRKGRWDELWSIDLPTATERHAIISAALRSHGREPLALFPPLIKATEGFTGAEIAALVPDALFTAFADGERALTLTDLAEAAARVVPLSQTAKEKIDRLREWAKGRARPATTREAEAEAGSGRAIDLD